MLDLKQIFAAAGAALDAAQAAHDRGDYKMAMELAQRSKALSKQYNAAQS